MVKEAIRRLQFTQQVKKAENGSNVKMKKLEITVSIDGVAIQVSFSFLTGNFPFFGWMKDRS